VNKKILILLLIPLLSISTPNGFSELEVTTNSQVFSENQPLFVSTERSANEFSIGMHKIGIKSNNVIFLFMIIYSNLFT